MAENIETIKKLEVTEGDPFCPWSIRFQGAPRSFRCMYPIHDDGEFAHDHYYYENGVNMKLVFEIHWQDNGDT